MSSLSDKEIDNNLVLDPERQLQAKKYAKIQRKFMLFDLGLGVVLLLAWLLLGWSALLRDWIFSWTHSPWIAVLAFGFIFGGVFTVLDLPLSYYTGFILPHRFQQSNQSRNDWVVDQLKGLLISGGLGAIMLEVIYLVLRLFPETWWLWTAGFLLLFNVLLTNLAPILLMPLFYKFSPLDEEDKTLGTSLLSLSEKAGISVMGVYKFDMSKKTKSANAGLTGLGNTRRIILGDTLLDGFQPDEIETVLAHELGHQKNNDIPLGMVVQTVLTLGGLYLTSLGLSWGISSFGFESVADIAALPLFFLSLGFYGLITMPISNGFSRWREKLADDFALNLTGKGKAYASALTRISNQNLADVDPEPWVEFLLHTHPALNKRIHQAENHS
ncbi:MAG: M48 family metallopeptidase [Chloroflexi bacterium]|nr:M48 family metallopeptidase [Chloroflexota bacterium]